MKFRIKRCPNCGRYTLSELCPSCNVKTTSPHPPPFSPHDKYLRHKIRHREEAPLEKE